MGWLNDRLSPLIFLYIVTKSLYNYVTIISWCTTVNGLLISFDYLCLVYRRYLLITIIISSFDSDPTIFIYYLFCTIWHSVPPARSIVSCPDNLNSEYKLQIIFCAIYFIKFIVVTQQLYNIDGKKQKKKIVTLIIILIYFSTHRFVKVKKKSLKRTFFTRNCFCCYWETNG